VSTKTPAAVTQRLAEALEKTRTPQTEERLKTAYVESLAIPRETVAEWVKASAGRWQAIARDAHIAID
jgi:tripartite-type tricarboxylate transporter receptor subunit TctC